MMGEAPPLEAKMVAYHISIFHGQYPMDKVGIARSREMRTLAEALDHVARGEIAQLSDLLMQRYKANEASVQDGNWALAQRYELIPDLTGGLASMEERRLAARAQVLASRLDAAVDHKKKKGSG